jgi:PKD repeat protein
MNKLYTLIAGFSLFASLTANAAGGPDAYGYTWITSLDVGGPTFSWIDITARPGVQSVTGLADDNSAPGMIPIGFPFHYYWSDYTQLKVGSNGWVAYNNISNMASCFNLIPTAGGAGDNYMAPLMGDLNFTGIGNPGIVRYWTNSVDTFIISYINVPFWQVAAPGYTAANNTFQIILCGSDSSITFQYGTVGGFVANAGCNDLNVGIENSSGAIGLQVHQDVMPPGNYVVRFDYPNPVLLAVQDPNPYWNTNVDNAAQFIINNAAFQLTTDFRNSGNTIATSNTALTASVTDAASTIVYSQSGNFPTMPAGFDSIYSWSPMWTPTATGQYGFQSSTTNAQDINPNNNILNTELDVVNPCVPTMLLTYNTAGANTGTINWNGGANDDGVGVYFQPPVAPYTISTLEYYIATPGTNNFIASVYDDDGPSGTPGTLLFTVTIPVAVTGWNSVPVAPAVTLPSGGYYVAWFQGGTTIFLGTETNGPRSHRNYEILDGSWATFRNDDTQDAMIRSTISGYAGTPTAGMSVTTNQLNLTTTNTTTGLATSHLWDFGDATTSTQAAPTHTYAAGGTYTVCLTESSPCGTSQVCTTITVCQTPTAAFMQSTNALNVNFMDMTTGTATTWAWDFGDAGTSTLQNPSHTYATGGTYTVCLIVGNNCGESDTICQAVAVCGVNSASFLSSSSGLNTNFMDMSTGAVDNWFWDFGDAGTSTSQSPAHTYAAPGTYNVCLIVSNNCGNADTICQMVTVCNLGVAAFTYTTDEDSIMVTDASTGGIMSWFWDFGDSTTSTLQNPGTHYYATGGIYTICLITTDSCGIQDTTCVQDTILITGYNVNVAGINSVYPNPATTELTVELWWNVPNDIEIYDATGNLVYRQNAMTGSVIRIDINDLSTGLYTLRVTNKGGTTVRRFVKE